VKKREFEESDLIMMFDIRYHRKANKNLLPKWFGPFIIKNVFTNNEFYDFKNVDGSLYLDCVNHDKLKKVLDI